MGAQKSTASPLARWSDLQYPSSSSSSGSSAAVRRESSQLATHKSEKAKDGKGKKTRFAVPDKDPEREGTGAGTVTFNLT